MIPFKNLEEISECHPGDEPFPVAISKVAYSVSLQPILYNLTRLPCEPSYRYQNKSMDQTFKAVERYLPCNSNLARFIRNHICLMEINESDLPKPEPLPTLNVSS